MVDLALEDLRRLEVLRLETIEVLPGPFRNVAADLDIGETDGDRLFRGAGSEPAARGQRSQGPAQQAATQEATPASAAAALEVLCHSMPRFHGWFPSKISISEPIGFSMRTGMPACSRRAPSISITCPLFISFTR